MRQLQDNAQGWILAAKVGQRTSLMLRYDLLRFPVLMRPYGWRAETPALLGRRAYLHANGCGLLSCSGRLIASFPLGIARRERRETVAWTASKVEDDMLAYVCREDLLR